MREDTKAMPTRLSAADFFSVLEGSGVLPEAKWREVRDRHRPGTNLDDATPVAQELVREGTLTAFQARRLLRGKRGLVVGRYVLLDLIGEGARGRVYKARHTLMDRVVALKAILPHHVVSKRSVLRFFREMKIVALLDHPNVVRAIDADDHEGCPYIIMEYLEGTDLEQIFVHRGPLPPDDVIAYIAQAVRGLAHAHERGVIHRDIKPTNLFLTNQGVVKLLDLGFGELVEGAQKAIGVFDTDEGTLVGTTDYMSPEQISYQPIDARTDLFGLGCAMYRLLTGCFAFPGETREDRLVKRLHEQAVPITDVRPDLPRGLVDVVHRLLAAQPDDRFGSAAELAEALEALLPPAPGSDRGAGGKSEESPETAVPSIHTEPEAPPDWSRIESALSPAGHGASNDSRLVDRREPRSPSSKGLSSHRQNLEDEGIESGREAHEQYRSELIQMNRVMAELRSMNPEEETTDSRESWFERIGEKLGDSLSEPSAGLILIGILGVLLVLVLAIAMAIG